jgi:mono/diheme cytochrome c family protein
MLQRSILLGMGLLLAVLALAIGAVAQEADSVTLTLPAGDPQAGREAFVELSCSSCHRVAGAKGLPTPTSANPGQTLGHYQAEKGAAMLGMSIFDPSHEISATVREREDELSPMPDFTRVMTVRQFLDLIAFLQSQ